MALKALGDPFAEMKALGWDSDPLLWPDEPGILESAKAGPWIVVMALELLERMALLLTALAAIVRISVLQSNRGLVLCWQSTNWPNTTGPSRHCTACCTAWSTCRGSSVPEHRAATAMAG